MEGTGEGCRFFCYLKLPYLSTISQQFCHRLSVHTGADNYKFGQVGASLCRVMQLGASWYSLEQLGAHWSR